MGEDLRGIALSMLRPVFTSISTKKGTLIIIQVQRQLEISFDISDEFDFIDWIFFFFFCIYDSMEEKIGVSLVKTFGWANDDVIRFIIIVVGD